jgi:uncharacterized protein (DUF697 family)
MTNEQRKKCEEIIHSVAAGTGAVGAGLSSTLVADTAVITPMQAKMIEDLGNVFGVEKGTAVMQGTISSVVAGIVGKNLVKIVTGWIPIAGNIINAATAAGITEAIGWMAVDQFERLTNKAW